MGTIILDWNKDRRQMIKKGKGTIRAEVAERFKIPVGNLSCWKKGAKEVKFTAPKARQA